MQASFRVVPTGPEHAAQLEALQRTCFPTLAEAERFTAAHYLKHIALFPEGQWVAVDGDSVIGMTSALRLDFDLDHPDHTFAEIIQGGWLTSHQPEGRWLYGVDIGTHPDHRGRGVARALYAARHAVVRTLGLEGQVTVGMLRGYAAHRDMSIEAYHAAVCSGARSDPTVSMQMHVGFRPRGLVRGYLDDPVCDGCGVLLVLPAHHDVG